MLPPFRFRLRDNSHAIQEYFLVPVPYSLHKILPKSRHLKYNPNSIPVSATFATVLKVTTKYIPCLPVFWINAACGSSLRSTTSVPSNVPGVHISSPAREANTISITVSGWIFLITNEHGDIVHNWIIALSRIRYKCLSTFTGNRHRHLLALSEVSSADERSNYFANKAIHSCSRWGFWSLLRDQHEGQKQVE